MKKARLTIEDRMLIEQLLRENYKLKDIARVIEVESSTISREIKFRRKANNSSFICDKTINILLFVLIVQKKFTVIRKNFIIILGKLKKIMKTN